MDTNTIIGYLILGTLLGTIGQGIRVVVGVKKQHDIATVRGTNREDWFDGGRIAVSLLIGAIAGCLGAITLWEFEIDRELLLTMIGIGYSGTDAIEGFMRTELPQPGQNTNQQNEEPTNSDE